MEIEIITAQSTLSAPIGVLGSMSRRAPVTVLRLNGNRMMIEVGVVLLAPVSYMIFI